MVYSAEIRWFFKNRADVAIIEKWFNAHEQYFADKWDRADIYLQQPNLNKLSVKIREGKVEVKVMLADRGVLPLQSGNNGIANDWVKYSFGLQESDEENKNLLQQFSRSTNYNDKSLWIRVDKERLLLKFSVDQQQNNLMQIPANVWPDEGCGVELTRIVVNQQTYYTFGLEAFSKTCQERQNLEIVLQQVIPEIQVTNLHPDQSHSYPGFLEKVNAV